MIYAISIIGLLLRLININQSLWLDEAASWTQAILPLNHFFVALRTDVHPPMFNLLLKVWILIFGDTEIVMRLLPVILGTLVIPTIYLLVLSLPITNEVQKKRIALFSALLMAINPLAIYYSQEIRMYSLTTLLTVLGWHYLGRNKTIFILISTANLYTFYPSIFILISQALYWYFHNKTRPKLFSMLFFFIPLFAVIPLLPITIQQVAGSELMVNLLPGWAKISGDLSLKSIILIPIKFCLGRINLSSTPGLVFPAALVIAYTTSLAILGTHHPNSKKFIYWLFTPLVLAITTSFKIPMLGYWRFNFLLPAFVILIAIGFGHLQGRLLYFNLILLLSIELTADLFYFGNPSFQRENWRATRTFITAPNSLVVVNFPDSFAPMKYYLPNQAIYPTQKKLGVIRDDIDESFSNAIGDHKTIYLFDYLSDITDHERKTKSWLVNAGFKLGDTYSLSGVGQIYEFNAN